MFSIPKLLIFVLVLAIIYFIFFKKKSVESGGSSTKDTIDDQTMVECSKCGTYVSTKESIMKDGKHYCSKECANG